MLHKSGPVNQTFNGSKKGTEKKDGMKTPSRLYTSNNQCIRLVILNVEVCMLTLAQ